MKNELIKRATWKGIKPHTWQKEAFSKIRNHFNGKNPKSVIVSAVTGSGKSAVISEIVQKIDLKRNESVLIIASGVKIVNQLHSVIENNVKIVGKFYGKEKILAKINVVSFHSLKKYLKQNKTKIKFIIIDECHRTEAELFKKNINSIKCKNILGLTATPYRAIIEEKLSIFDEVLYSFEMKRSLESNITVDWVIKNKTKEFHAKSNYETCYKMIKNAKGKGLVNSTTIEEAIRFNDYLLKKGIKSLVVHSYMSLFQQDKRFDLFVNKRYKCLVHVNMLKEGIDMPFLKWILLRRKTTSRVRFVQEIGRALRVFKNKKKATFYDPNDLFGRFKITQDAEFGKYMFDKTSIETERNVKDLDGEDENDEYYTILVIENIIRNIQVKFQTYGFNTTRVTLKKTAKEKTKLKYMATRNSVGLPCQNKWRIFFDSVNKNIAKMSGNYLNVLIRILEAIKIIDFYPKFDGQTIKFTRQQRLEIEAFNEKYRYKNELITYKGVKRTKREWALKLGLHYSAILYRKKSGWSDRECIEGKDETILIGKKYGKVTVISKDSVARGAWLYLCDCGTFGVSGTYHLVNRKCQSCGCNRSANILAAMKRKGTSRRGENVGMAVLNTKQVISIYQSSKSSEELSKMYKVSFSCIQKIKFNVNWTHVTKNLKRGLRNEKKKKVARLKKKQVISIYKSSKSTQELSKMYKVSFGRIQKIKSRVSWSHITKNMKRGVYKRKASKT